MVLLLLVEVEAEDGAMELRQQWRWKVQGPRGTAERGGTEWIWTMGSRRTMAASDDGASEATSVKKKETAGFMVCGGRRAQERGDVGAFVASCRRRVLVAVGLWAGEEHGEVETEARSDSGGAHGVLLARA